MAENKNASPGRLARVIALALFGGWLFAGLAACQSEPGPTPATTVVSDPNAPVAGGDVNAASFLAQSYRLGPGDRIRVIVFQEPDLSGEFEVDSTGKVSLPLVEAIPAQGKTIDEFQNDVVRRLSDGYLVSPRVSTEILNYRPFYITGEVNRPGEYAYVAGMNILKAIAMAGGYTYRANENRVHMTRVNTQEELIVEPTPDVIVMPGDFIRIPERFF